MVLRIGLVAQRAEMVLEVAAIAGRLGAEVAALPWGEPAGKCAFVLVDWACVTASHGSTAPSYPQHVLICLRAEVERASSVAARLRLGGGHLGGGHLVVLPDGGGWLCEQLGQARRPAVLGVVAATGGAGATITAVACALPEQGCLLVDADPLSVGLDIPLGIAAHQGARISAIPIGDEPLDAASLRQALPLVAGVHVATGSAPAQDLGATISRLLAVGRASFPKVVLDGGRASRPPPWLAASDPVVVVAPGTVSGLTAAGRFLEGCEGRRIVVAIRPVGWLPMEAAVAHLRTRTSVRFGEPVAIPQLARLGERSDCGDLTGGRLGRALQRLGETIWQAAA